MQVSQERTVELTRINDELKREIAQRETAEREALALKNELAADLKAMCRLHELSTRLLVTTELQPLFEEILAATIELQNADFGNIQLYDPQEQALQIVAQRGFHQDFLDYFSCVEDTRAACGRAWQCRERVIIEDIEVDPDFLPHRKIAASAGFRAVQSTPLFNPKGEPLGMISTHFRQPHRPSSRELRLTDLYARKAGEMIANKRSEEALRRSEERFRLLVERMEDYAIFALDVDGSISSWNAGAERVEGYRSEEILGRHFSVFYPAESKELAKPETALRLAAAQGRFEDEGWRIRRNGSRFWAHTVLTALRDEQGKLTGFAKITHDLTQRKRAQDAKLTTMGEMTASIAHEINQPLGTIITNANACQRMLAGKSPNLNEVRLALSDIADAGTRAGEVISRIRALLKKQPFEKARIDINGLIQEVLRLMPRELEKHGISLETELDSGLPPVLGDRIQLQQVMLNLITNAIEAMASVTGYPKVLHVRSKLDSSGSVLIFVQDSGPGLDTDKIQHIFESFFTTKRGGMGMGLPISRSIVEAHGGRLWADPGGDRGTVFQFTLAAV